MINIRYFGPNVLFITVQKKLEQFIKYTQKIKNKLILAKTKKFGLYL